MKSKTSQHVRKVGMGLVAFWAYLSITACQPSANGTNAVELEYLQMPVDANLVDLALPLSDRNMPCAVMIRFSWLRL